MQNVDFNTARQQALDDINKIYETTKKAMDNHEIPDYGNLYTDLGSHLKTLLNDPNIPDSVKQDFQNVLGKIASSPQIVDLSSVFQVQYDLTKL